MNCSTVICNLTIYTFDKHLLPGWSHKKHDLTKENLILHKWRNKDTGQSLDGALTLELAVWGSQQGQDDLQGHIHGAGWVQLTQGTHTACGHVSHCTIWVLQAMTQSLQLSQHLGNTESQFKTFLYHKLTYLMAVKCSNSDSKLILQFLYS